MYGKSKNLYAVRKRVGCKKRNGRHVPVNGPTIEHIIDGKYVPIPEEKPPVSQVQINLKDWADIILCDNIFRDMLPELERVYNRVDALKLYCILILRVCDPGIKDNELKETYDTSFLSERYRGIALSKNTVSTFLGDLGRAVSRIVEFMRNRTIAVSMDHHLLVDGTLKSDESMIHSLSDFSRKARTKGIRDLSVLFAFDLESMELICSKCFPGNMLDATSYESFIVENRITKGIIVGDKGFPESAAHNQFENNPDLHYLNPVKRNSKFNATHHMLDSTGLLPGYEGITYRKEKCSGTNKWLYSFRSSAKAAGEEQDWLRRAKKEGTYDLEVLQKKQKSFGTIILESDLDLPPEIAYKAYNQRWEIEIVMRFYKSACDFDETRVHDDYSVIGSEFCDFLSSVLTFRLIKVFDQTGLLEKYTYKKLLSILIRAKKIRVSGSDWQLIKIHPSYMVILRALSLLPNPEELPKKKRGRPKENKNIPKNPSAELKVKRRRGKPKGSKNKPKP